MLTSTGSGAISGVRPSNPYYHTERESAAQAVANPQYDSVTLSPKATGGNRFHMELVSRLSQEVRTATTTGDIQTIKRAVSSGSYQPNPMDIAARMLFLAEEA